MIYARRKRQRLLDGALEWLLLGSILITLGFACGHPVQGSGQDKAAPLANQDDAIQSAVQTFLGTTDGSAISVDLDAIATTAQRAGYRLICRGDTLLCLQFPNTTQTRVWISSSGGILVLHAKRLRNLADKDQLEARLLQTLRIVASVTATIDDPRDDQLFRPSAFVSALYETVHFYNTGDKVYQSLILPASGENATLNIPSDANIQEGRIQSINGARHVSVTRINFDGERLKSLLRQPRATWMLTSTVGSHQLEWCCNKDFYRIEFIGEGQEAVTLSGFSSQYVFSSDISGLNVPSCSETADSEEQ